jgi:two-component system, NtrC family, sensor kinase
MDSTADQETLAQLQKENRILNKQLERANNDRVRLEGTNRKKEILLKKVITEVQASQSTLEKKSNALEQAINDLKMMQDKLVEAEKMSALGTLVAGIAHEINTPVGTSITLASTLGDETAKLMKTLADGQLKRSEFKAYLDIAAEASNLLLANLNRAGELVQSFKQVSVDQANLDQRTFRIVPYLEEVAISLSPHLKKTTHTLTVSGNDQIEIDSYPGAIAQIATNLVTNSLNHAFSLKQHGQMKFEITLKVNHLLITYRDNGCGIPVENLNKVFNPFFTTARSQGGTGLGLHIVYNLVTQTLNGQIDVSSEVNKGTSFQIILPLSTLS